jgi:hypothetical protein
MRSRADLLSPARRRRDPDHPARPLTAALPQICLAPLVLAVSLAVGVGWPWLAAIACSLLAVGLVQGALAAAELGRRRRVADEWLLWGAATRPSSALLGWRAGELTSPRLRSTLAHSLKRIERETQGGTLPGPIPLNKRALRCHLGLLRALYERLEDRARPVSARGMVLVDRLLTEPGSPLYSRVPDGVVAEALSEALAAVEPVAAAAAAA